MVSLRIKNRPEVGSRVGVHQSHHQERHSLSEVVRQETSYVEECCIDLLKRIPSWSQTGKRGRHNNNTIVFDDDDDDNHKNKNKNKIDDNKVVYNAMPLSVYFSPEVSLTQQTRLDGFLTTSKSKRPNEHRCEICGKTFSTGQALGGHKTSHRTKPLAVVDYLASSASGETGQITDFFIDTTMLMPMGLYGKGGSSEASYDQQLQHPKTEARKMLDIDLNIPYLG